MADPTTTTLVMAASSEVNGRSPLIHHSDTASPSIQPKKNPQCLLSAARSIGENKPYQNVSAIGSTSSAVRVEQPSNHVASAIGISNGETAMGHTTACNEKPKTSYQVGHAPAQGLTSPTMPLDPLSTFKFTLQALSTQLATTQLPRSELERALNLLNSIDTMVSKAASRGEFELFPKLPIELRLRIWQYAAWHPRVIAIKDDYNPTHMALCGSNARCPLVRVNKEAREEVVKIKIDFNARCQIDGAPKIWVNLAVDTIVRISHTCEYAVYVPKPETRFATICQKLNFQSQDLGFTALTILKWIMNWNWSPCMSGGSATSSWDKCKDSSLSSVKKLAMCENIIVNFFDISADSRADELHIKELFVLTNAEDRVLDVDTVQLTEPKQDPRLAMQFSTRNTMQQRRNLIGATEFWYEEARNLRKQIKAIKAHSQDLFIRKTNGNGPTGALGALLTLRHYDYLRDLSKWKIPRVRCKEVALHDKAT